MRFRIKNPTLTEGAFLCPSCTRSCIAKGASTINQIMYCSFLDENIPFKVVDCNGYTNKNDRSLYEFEKTAWVVEASPARKVGFSSPKKWQEANPHRGPLDGLIDD